MRSATEGHRSSELPMDVVNAIRSGQTIKAIKLLRTYRSLSLKEAKGQVEAYVAERPDVGRYAPPASSVGVGKVLIAALMALVAYFVFRAFT